MDLNDEVLKTIIFSEYMRKLALVHAVICAKLFIEGNNWKNVLPTFLHNQP